MSGELAMTRNWQTVRGVVERGHQVASRKSDVYPRGTIEMQVPYFRELGLDLSGLYWATLNVSIRPYVFAMKAPEHTFRGVRWTSKHPPEDFSFSRCRVRFEGAVYEGWLYYPHPETKKRHFQTPSLMEIITPRIPGIGYGDLVEIEVDAAEVQVETG